MDVSVKESKLLSTAKRGNNLHKASSILSVVAILLTIALFVKMETVVNDAKVMDSKFTLEIQQIKDALEEGKAFHQAGVKHNFDIVSGKLLLVVIPLFSKRRSVSTRGSYLLLKVVYSGVRLSRES